MSDLWDLKLCVQSSKARRLPEMFIVKIEWEVANTALATIEAEAAKRKITVQELITRAVCAYLAGEAS